jgi:hypothetical protein
MRLAHAHQSLDLKQMGGAVRRNIMTLNSRQKIRSRQNVHTAAFKVFSRKQSKSELLQLWRPSMGQLSHLIG